MRERKESWIRGNERWRTEKGVGYRKGGGIEDGKKIRE